MKKYLILAVIICATVFLFSNCHTQKKGMASTSPIATVTYASAVKSVVAANCTPCHIPANGGNKTPLDTYDNLKANIDNVIHRIQLNPTDKGFMPFKHAKLSDSTIAVFTQWRDAGMPQ